MNTIRPVRISKADEQLPIEDGSLKVTCVYAVDPLGIADDKSKALEAIGGLITKQLKGEAPDAEVATYPNPDDPTSSLSQPDPDYPSDPVISVFESVRDSDVFLFKTTTSSYGIATAASAFFDRFNRIVKHRFDGIFPEANRVAGVVVIGGSGARDLASSLVCMLSDMGFTIPPHAVVIYEDSTENKKGDKATASSPMLVSQCNKMVESVVRLSKKLKMT